jgi:hypothetical protein
VRALEGRLAGALEARLQRAGRRHCGPTKSLIALRRATSDADLVFNQVAKAYPAVPLGGVAAAPPEDAAEAAEGDDEEEDDSKFAAPPDDAAEAAEGDDEEEDEEAE